MREVGQDRKWRGLTTALIIEVSGGRSAEVLSARQGPTLVGQSPSRKGRSQRYPRNALWSGEKRNARGCDAHYPVGWAERSNVRSFAGFLNAARPAFS